MLNFPNSLLIGTHFDVFMLSIASGEGLAVGRSIGIKNPHVRKGSPITASPKPTGNNVQSGTVLRYG